MVVVAEPTIPCDRRKKMALRLSGLAMNIRPNATASASFAFRQWSQRTVLACAPFAPSTSTKRTVRRQMI
jgi:hypothetical protein